MCDFRELYSLTDLKSAALPLIYPDEYERTTVRGFVEYIYISATEAAAQLPTTAGFMPREYLKAGRELLHRASMILSLVHHRERIRM